MDTKTIIFIGPQGSGKGTQVELLIKALEGSGAQKVLNLQTGKPFREMMERGSYTATRVKSLMNNGLLVPDWLTDAMVARELESALADDMHIIFDGYPRNLAQANVLEDMLAFYGRTDLFVVWLDTPESVVRERMMGRGREDDTEEAIDTRLALYKEMTEPVIEYYKKRVGTNFVTVDGSDSIESVQGAIKTGLSVTE